MKYNKTKLNELIENDYINFRIISKNHINFLANYIKKIDLELLEIHDYLFNFCLTNKLTYKIGIDFKDKRKFLIWYKFNKFKKKWEYSNRNYRSITTTIRNNDVFINVRDELLQYLDKANKLMKLREEYCIDHQIENLVKKFNKKFERVVDGN